MMKLRFIMLFTILIVNRHISNAQTNYNVAPKKNTTETTNSNVSLEETFAKKHFPYIHMANWKKGMRFIVQTPEKDLYSSSINLRPYKSKTFSNRIEQKDFKGKIFTVEDVEEREVKCPRGKCIRTYIIFNCESKKYEYEFIGSREEMLKAKAFINIDRLVYIDEIDKARELLIDKKLYFTAIPLSRHPRFIPVTIKNVGVSNSTLWGNVKIIYATDDNKEYEVSLSLSGTNDHPYRNKNFYNTFSFDNPKDEYPDISDENWVYIQYMNVKIGMSKKECTLAWGKPEKVNKNISKYESSEQWVYSSNRYLYFDTNGKLSHIQK